MERSLRVVSHIEGLKENERLEIYRCDEGTPTVSTAFIQAMSTQTFITGALHGKSKFNSMKLMMI